MKNLNKLVHLYLQNLGSLENKTIVVGYSGGADSTALMDILAQKQEVFKYQLKAVFFQHEGSPLIEDESTLLEHCRDFCRSLNVPLMVHHLNLTQKHSNQSWESSGRISRMDFYEKNKFDMVFLGHHKDDQDETTLIQLFRGGGRGITGMKKEDGIYYRPFLDIHKKDIYEYLNHKKITWIEDSTNEDTTLTRNFWRKKLIPLLKQYYPHFTKQLDSFRAKSIENNQLNYELAQVDGLNELIQGQTINIKNLSELRLKNLIKHYFYHFDVTLDNAFLIKNMDDLKNKNKAHFNKDNHDLYVDEDTISTVSLTHLKNKKNKI